MKKIKKDVEIVYSKELIDINPKAEEELKESLKVFKNITDYDDGNLRRNYGDDVLKLFIENLKNLGIEFPITITNLIALDEKSNTTVLEFVTSDDVIGKIVLKNLYYKMMFQKDQIIVERQMGRILISEKFKGFFKEKGDRILKFKLKENNLEEKYVNSILSFIPKTVQFEVENSMFFEARIYYEKYSLSEYLKFINETNFKEIKNANQLNQKLSNFFKLKSSSLEIFLFKEMNNGYNASILHAFGVDCNHSLLKGVSGCVPTRLADIQYMYAETFDEDITFFILVYRGKVFLYLYQNGDWVISSEYDPRKREVDTGEIVVRYPKLDDFYEENQLDIIAKAKKILKENLSSFALKLLQEVEKDITSDAKLKFIADILRNLAEPQIFEN